MRYNKQINITKLLLSKRHFSFEDKIEIREIFKEFIDMDLTPLSKELPNNFALDDDFDIKKYKYKINIIIK